MRKCFFVHCGDSAGTALVAESRNQAKMMALKEEWFEGVKYTELRTRVLKGAQVADLDVGTSIHGVDGLKRGVYTFVQDWCPFHPETRPELVNLRMEEGQILCDCCSA